MCFPLTRLKHEPIILLWHAAFIGELISDWLRPQGTIWWCSGNHHNHACWGINQISQTVMRRTNQLLVRLSHFSLCVDMLLVEGRIMRKLYHRCYAVVDEISNRKSELGNDTHDIWLFDYIPCAFAHLNSVTGHLSTYPRWGQIQTLHSGEPKTNILSRVDQI